MARAMLISSQIDEFIDIVGDSLDNAMFRVKLSRGGEFPPASGGPISRFTSRQICPVSQERLKKCMGLV